MFIKDIATLRSLYAAPLERVIKKQMPRLDEHCRSFIRLSPFAVLATSDPSHNMDASPRGGRPGFVRIAHDDRLLIPDSPGNNRLDTLENIVETGGVGVLFLIPGFDETLRVNGSAALSCAPADIAACTDERRTPKLVISIAVEAAYLHCAKAFLRSKLWSPQALTDRSMLPTAGRMISDQTGIASAPETREEMERRYQSDL